ncbi:MAG TPA: hypothetical protein VFQ61_11570 [Polyangiaceae bacterium]|nr:hypothetical protein [Polyangiaceae bacterium]
MKREELIMRHYDGELDAGRVPELERSLASDPRARTELEQLELLGSLVREARAIPDIDFSARIFEKLGLSADGALGTSQGADCSASSEKNSVPESSAGPAPFGAPAPIVERSGMGTAAVERAVVERAVVERALVERAAPSAPRHSRRIRPALALAGVSSALALAAAVALWLTRPAPSAFQAVAAQVSSPTSDIAAPAPAISVPDPEPPEQSVAVERVDFGSSQGAIFLVPNADERTLVVWTLDELTDDDEGEEADL